MKKLFIIVFLLCAVILGAIAQTIVTSEDELKYAVNNGGEVKLGNDVIDVKEIFVPTGKSVVFDLNGHKLEKGKAKGMGLFTVLGTLTIKDSSGNNSGLITGSSRNTGGAFCNHGTLVIEGGTISGNTSSGVGGAICNYGTLTITGGAFIGNTAELGGAIYNLGNASITGVVFSGNKAHKGGGAICNNGDGSLIIANCAISNNSTEYEKAGTIGGGGIHIISGTATIKDGSVICDNTAFMGGGIYVSSYATLVFCGSDTTFVKGNKSPRSFGGGIVNKGTVEMAGNVAIVCNTSHADGSGIWNEGSLKMQGSVNIHNNGTDDVFLREGTQILCTGAFDETSRIGVHRNINEVCFNYSVSFTKDYGKYNSQNNHFFSNDDRTFVAINDAREGWFDVKDSIATKYYDCSWDKKNKKVIHTLRLIPVDKSVDNICSEKYARGGDLWGDSYWFVAKGKATISESITCQNENVHIILCDDAEVTFKKGLLVKPSTRLHIYSQSYGDHMGKIIAHGTHEDAAAIGGKKGMVSGDIIFHGGNIEATGGSDGAAIGGGDEDDSGFKDIIIYDGIIHAQGGNYSAGIGCGDDNDNYGSLTIYGGSIWTKGGSRGAGIGGGEGCNGFDVSILGGYVCAESGTTWYKEDFGDDQFITPGVYRYDTNAFGRGRFGITDIISYITCHNGTLSFGDDMVVQCNEKVTTGDDRKKVCWENPIVIVYADENAKANTVLFTENDDEAFADISETTGIEKSLPVETENKIMAVYTLNGALVNNPTKGIYIVKYTNGTSRKVNIR